MSAKAKVTIQPSNLQFDIADSDKQQTILDNAIKNDIQLPYSCKKGVCGVCKSKVVSGKTKFTIPENEIAKWALSNQERENGYILTCISQIADGEQNLNLHCANAVQAHLPTPQVLRARIESMEKLDSDIMKVILRLAATNADNQKIGTLQFVAGQYLKIMSDDKRPRAFSIANLPNDKNEIELHIRSIEGGYFTPKFFDGTFKVKDIVDVIVPLGNFILRKDSANTLVFVAGGTGFAPIQAILEDYFANNADENRPVYLFWGVRTPSGLYAEELLNKWQQQHKNFNYVPVVSDENNNNANSWNGETGLVHNAVEKYLQNVSNLSNADFYLCGNKMMISAMNNLLAANKVSEAKIFSDAF